MISDAKKSIVEYLKDRTASPFFGTFLFSWLAWNWKAVSIYIFSKEDIYKKISNLTTFHGDIELLLWAPLTTALALVLIYPILSSAAHILWKYASVFRDNAFLRIERKQLMPVEASNKLRVEIARLENFAETEISDRDQQIEQLKNTVKELQKKLGMVEKGEIASTPPSRTIRLTAKNPDGDKDHLLSERQESWHAEYISLNATDWMHANFDALERYSRGTYQAGTKTTELGPAAQKALFEKGYIATNNGVIALTEKGNYIISKIRRSAVKIPVVSKSESS